MIKEIIEKFENIIKELHPLKRGTTEVKRNQMAVVQLKSKKQN